MNITQVKVFPTHSESKIRAMASITIDDCFAVTGLKIMDGSKGLFVSMPSRKTPDGEYKDICYPIDKGTRETIQEMILAKYTEPTGASENPLPDDDDELPF